MSPGPVPAPGQPVLPGNPPISGTNPTQPSRSGKRAPVPYVALTGNPNCGKTTLFNALTGMRAKVGNYAGVTVERKEGRLQGTSGMNEIRVLDLPGTYSLSPQSLDEQISRDVLLNRLSELPAPALIVLVVDASNLQRNLYYATQVIELGYPTIVALNMVDVANANGHAIDATKLSALLGAPVLPVIASENVGVPELRKQIIADLDRSKPVSPSNFCVLPPAFAREVEQLAAKLADTFHERKAQAAAEALLILSNERALASSAQHYPLPIQQAVGEARQRLETAGVDWRGSAIESRYTAVHRIQSESTTESSRPGETFSDRLDRVLTHKVWGTLIFLGVMLLMFQSIFTFAQIPMEAMQGAVDWIGTTVSGLIPSGDFNSLMVHGVIAGVGAVVIFLPQILLLFLFIGFLEDTGYMARAAFLMDRVMSKVGLHGKSFIPLLSSFACAIPGIMSARTIESPKDRLVTILVAPLMSCSARLPVYTVLIAACIPDKRVLGFLKLSALTLLTMYLLGIVVALIMAWLFKKTLLKGEPPLLIMELPPYKRPLLRMVVRHMWERAKIFLKQAGTVILGINILLWFLATYPRSAEVQQEYAAKRAIIAASTPLSTGIANGAEQDEQLKALADEEAGTMLRNSFAGRLGRLIEPVIAPLGFDWKIGIGIVSSFAAREVFVSAMSTVYNVGGGDNDGVDGIVKTLKEQVREDGRQVYTPLTGLTLMVFYVFALQCVSTIAIMRRETNSWRWPVFQWVYLGVLAWSMAFVTFRLGQWLCWS
jgi:ferrous iron transport protein B